MVRAPCCEKMGLKKGPWTPEEDQILINYIQQYGHGNWRALPKQAGLLRCGKSCRLRWINYLRPDIKRGNFTREEEDAIIQLHEMLGNRWSAIAARLPGRTDNEIKNVWHTHLKKRLKQNNNSNLTTQENREHSIDTSTVIQELKSEAEPEFGNFSNLAGFQEYRPISPQQCSSSDQSSTITTGDDTLNNTSSEKVESSENLDDSFWSEVLSSDHSSSATQFDQIPFSPVGSGVESVQYGCNYSSMDMEFWFNLFTRAGESLEFE